MNLRLCGICFKMRGGPDLLDYVQSGSNVPVGIMQQVLEQMDSITREEMAFAEQLDTDWKKAFNERVPFTMGVSSDGGYDITCSVPDELLATVRVLTGLENEKIVEEYTADYLKNVCGVDAPIISVDMETVAEPEKAIAAAPAVQGFDISDLGAEPEEPAFEDVSRFMGMDMETPAVHMVPAAEEPVVQEEPDYGEPVPEEPIPDEEPYPEDGVPEGDFPEEDEMPGEAPAYDGDDVPIEEGYPEDGSFPDMEDEEPYGEPEAEDAPVEGQPEENAYGAALKNIYTDLVGNIKDRRLDERLGLNIG